MRWEPGDERDSRVVRFDGWLDLPDVEAPDEKGVFVFVSGDLEVRYVGCASESLNEEIKNALGNGLSAGASMCSWFVTGSKDDAESLKEYWVGKYRPGNN